MNDDDWDVADLNRGEGVNVQRVEVLPYCVISSPRFVPAKRSGREEMKVAFSSSVGFPFLCNGGGLHSKAVYLGHVCRSGLKEVKEGSRREADGRREAEREAAVGGFAAVGEGTILAVVVFQKGAREWTMATGLVDSDGEGASRVDERRHVVLLLLLFLIIPLQLLVKLLHLLLVLLGMLLLLRLTLLLLLRVLLRLLQLLLLLAWMLLCNRLVLLRCGRRGEGKAPRGVSRRLASRWSGANMGSLARGSIPIIGWSGAGCVGGDRVAIGVVRVAFMR